MYRIDRKPETCPEQGQRIISLIFCHHRVLAYLVTVLAFPVFLARADGDVDTKVREYVLQIKTMHGFSECGFFELPEMTAPSVTGLLNLGMDVLPKLTPYLRDTTFTDAYRIHGSGNKRRVRVNEYIIFAINHVSDHYFFGPDQPLTEEKDVLELQHRIDVWWGKNKGKSLLDRKLEDVHDSHHYNRFAAYAWLAQAKSEQGRMVLEQRIDELLKDGVDTLKQSEMATCAENLVKIANPKSIASVRRVCDHLSYWVYMSYRPIEEGRAGTGSQQISTLFSAYQALAKLGCKQEAISHLDELKRKFLKEMESRTQQEFLDYLEDAKKW